MFSMSQSSLCKSYLQPTMLVACLFSARGSMLPFLSKGEGVEAACRSLFNSDHLNHQGALYVRLER